MGAFFRWFPIASVVLLACSGCTKTPPDQNILSVFLNLRVTDIRRYYDLWSSRGAKFITEPKVHARELRCYMRDPDGYLIEVGQTTDTAAPLDLYV